MTDITVSEELASRIETRVEHTEFETTDEYAEFVLSEVVTRVERETEQTSESSSSREGVQERLESLGYLEE
ncbi:hypothetical protein [Haloquadratum walsbyi]|uniref:CopG domain protein n=1 Tax=Haloquadratum walsbyi (strain DSM 16790 / HBSQ001) TaxID=362976 RepID=Q18EJ2_HALWD|nr:hypothetical protein [Haloquadratum walsbyi]CAJ53632.1 CopG domain protein [Haloquadratum walsbyi DSM 16790]